MKITRRQLRQIIKEELGRLNEDEDLMITTRVGGKAPFSTVEQGLLDATSYFRDKIKRAVAPTLAHELQNAPDYLFDNDEEEVMKKLRLFDTDANDYRDKVAQLTTGSTTANWSEVSYTVTPELQEALNSMMKPPTEELLDLIVDSRTWDQDAEWPSGGLITLSSMLSLLERFLGGTQYQIAVQTLNRQNRGWLVADRKKGPFQR